MKSGALHFGLMETDNYSSYNLCHPSKGFWGGVVVKALRY